ncbi:MAG: unclassified family transposase [Candidatus Angelobacter sp.]|nr:unclassified family transposase [Candidatus Angelobacter sp.]
MKQPNTLQQAIQHFSDEQVCIDAVASMRWPEGVVCPACEHKEHYYLKTQKRWKCKDCGRQFSVKLGTIFEDSAIPLNKWLVALWMLVNCRNGVSSYEVGRAVGITQKSAWFVLHRLRLALQGSGIVKLGGPNSTVEVDETYIGGKARNMHAKVRRRRNVKDIGAKSMVMGAVERGGKVYAKVVANRQKETIKDVIFPVIEQGTTVHTDEFPAYIYAARDNEFEHKVINHLEKYVDGNVHTNGIENFWSLLKRGLGGTYVAVEPFHLFRYVDEQAFRFNHRVDTDGNKIEDGERFAIALSHVAGKRLTFAEVTGKVQETTF